MQERGFLGGGWQIVGYELPAQGEDARHVEVVFDALFELGHVAVVGFRRRTPSVGGGAQPVEGRSRAAETFPSEGELGSVARPEAEKAVGERVVALFDEGFEAQEVAARLGHLLPVELQERAVEPEFGQPRVVAGLGLGDLVGVVDRDVILAAAVDVEVRPQVLGRHGRAFDVPAGEAAPPRAVPFHLPLCLCRAELPQREVREAAFLPEIDALAAL